MYTATLNYYDYAESYSFPNTLLSIPRGQIYPEFSKHVHVDGSQSEMQAFQNFASSKLYSWIFAHADCISITNQALPN